MLQVYLTLRTLPEHLRPCLVTRVPGMTMVAVNLGADRLRVIEWFTLNLTLEERNAYRAALGHGPVGTPLNDSAFDAPEHVPAALMTRAERRARNVPLGRAG